MTSVPVRWLTVFLDFPAGSFGAGVAFWREVTGSTLSAFRGAASPGGFTFCLVRWHGEGTVPGPVRLDGAGASRADELCLDIPAGTFARERSFWSALTGWEGQAGARSGSACLDPPAGMPVRLWFRRGDGGDPVTGHIGFACDDRRALARRHAAAGARVLAVLPHETTMADPVGRLYRLTGG